MHIDLTEHLNPGEQLLLNPVGNLIPLPDGQVSVNTNSQVYDKVWAKAMGMNVFNSFDLGYIFKLLINLAGKLLARDVIHKIGRCLAENIKACFRHDHSHDCTGNRINPDCAQPAQINSDSSPGRGENIIAMIMGQGLIAKFSISRPTLLACSMSRILRKMVAIAT